MLLLLLSKWTYVVFAVRAVFNWVSYPFQMHLWDAKLR